jgi:thioredoxin reductase (NADPH)
MAHKDVVIIGAGPSGVATAIQLKRQYVGTTIFESDEIGGLLRNAHLVENYPGFPGGITGPDLAERFKRQLEAVGVEVRFEKVHKLEYGGQKFLLETDQGATTAAVAVVAAGTRPRKIPLPPAAGHLGDRIFYEVHRLLEIEDKKVAILGAGDAAFDYALNLSRKNEVFILNRSQRSRCLPLLWDRCRRSEKISYYDGVSLRNLTKEGTGLLLDCALQDDPGMKGIYVDYMIVAAGREPCLDFLGDDLKENLPALLETDKLFMVGDVKNGRYRQTAICVGDGVRAAMRICETIAGEAG